MKENLSYQEWKSNFEELIDCLKLDPNNQYCRDQFIHYRYEYSDTYYRDWIADGNKWVDLYDFPQENLNLFNRMIKDIKRFLHI